MKKNKLALLLIGTMSLSMMFSGCGKKKAAEEEPVSTETPSVSVDAVATMSDASEIQLISREGYVLSELTGEWIDESLENQRPLSIMINNIIDAMPQSYISQADITYEMLVEGDVTRYLCVFKDYASVGKLGPVRSARHYYIQLSDMLNSFYAHFGWSPLAEAHIDMYGTDNINGLFDGQAYYRDESRYAPHNVYTDGDRLKDAIERYGYKTEYRDNQGRMFMFNIDDTPIGNGQTANKVTTAYFGNPSRWFEYNEEEKVYYRFQYNKEQMDDQFNTQLSYKNVIVMFVDYIDLDGYYRDVDWMKGGTAMYCTDGEYEQVTWKNDNGQVKYYTSDGKQLKMNPGKTFITVFDEDKPQNVIFE